VTEGRFEEGRVREGEVGKKEGVVEDLSEKGLEMLTRIRRAGSDWHKCEL